MNFKQKAILFVIRHFGLSMARLVPRDLLRIIEELGDEADNELKRRMIKAAADDIL